MRWAALAFLAAPLSGCILAVVAVAAAVGMGAYLYLDNTLSYEYPVSLDKAWGAAKEAASDLDLKPDSEKKDFQEGDLDTRMADGRNVCILCERQGDKSVRIKVRVGDFKGEANRQAAQTIHEKIAERMGLEAPGLPPAEDVSEDEMQKMYKAPLGACYEAAMKACQGEGYKPSDYERSGETRGRITAKGKDRQAYVSLQRHENRTRVVIQVRGGETDEMKKAAKGLHEALGKQLGEKGSED